VFEERPFLGTIDQRLTGDRVSVKVTLGWAEDMYEGASDGLADPGHRPRLVGEATLRAIESVSGDQHRYDLSAVGTSDLGPVRIALVQVREVGWSDYLIGSALIRDADPATATAKAVLDALNRRISRIIS
jgi:hypothetical protein